MSIGMAFFLCVKHVDPGQVNYSILGRLIDRMGGGFFSAIYACVIAIDENLTTADDSSVPTY